MRQVLLAAATALAAVVSCAAALAASGDGAPATNAAAGGPPAKPADDPNRKICKREESTGSHFAEHVCMTKAQWDAITERSQNMLNSVTHDAAQNGQTTAGGAPAR